MNADETEGAAEKEEIKELARAHDSRTNGGGDNFVEVGAKAKPVTLERLFETYTFLDDEPCGVMEK